MEADNLGNALKAINLGLSFLESMTASTEVMEKISSMILAATSEKRSLSDEEMASLVTLADQADADLEAALVDDPVDPGKTPPAA